MNRLVARRVAVVAALLALVTAVALVRAVSASPVPRSVAVGANPVALALDERAGRAFVLSDSGVTAMDIRTGAVIYTVAVGGGASALAVDERSGRVFVAGTDAAGPTGSPIGAGSVSVFSARDGTLLRSTEVGVTPSALALDARGGLLVVAGGSAPNATGSRDVLLLDSRRLSIQHGVSAGPTNGAATGLFSEAVAIDARSRHSIVASSDGSVSLLDLQSGRVLRTSALNTVCAGPYHFPVAVAVDERSGRAFVADHDGGCIGVVDVRGGALLRGVAVGGRPLGLALDEVTGRVFVADASGATVSMLDARSGRLLRTVRVRRNPHAMAVDEVANRVYVANQGDSSVSVLDATSGALLRTVTVPDGPIYVAVDERIGRVVVVSDGGVIRPDPWSWLPVWARSRLTWLPRTSQARPSAGSDTILDAAR